MARRAAHGRELEHHIVRAQLGRALDNDVRTDACPRSDLDALTDRILAFEGRYNATATPFDWRFTRTDLDRLLDRIAAHEATAPIQSTGLATT